MNRFFSNASCVGLLFIAALARTGTAHAQANAVPASLPKDAAYVLKSPDESAIPDGGYGKSVKEGEQIFLHTQQHAGAFVGNNLNCASCHLDAGRKANASPFGAAYVAYPAYRSKNGHVNTFAERLQGCFRYSMNGKVPPLGDPVLVSLESYAAWLSKGAPVGGKISGSGYPKVPKPALPADYLRGSQVYAQTCALCHGATGHGQLSDGKMVFPALWGNQSFNWGAGMHSVDNAAGFIKANMPLALGNTLTDQQAWDVAMFMDSHERPQDPRFTGSVAQTRLKYHDSEYSMYGRTVQGHMLGSQP
jgi:thiosulfate dehydrogenase